MLRLLVSGLVSVTAAVVLSGVTQPVLAADKPAASPALTITDPVPAGFRSWDEVMDVQRRLGGAADRITKLVEDSDAQGYAAITAAPEDREVHLYWKGTVPAPVQDLLTELRPSVPVSVLGAPYSAQELQTEVQRIIERPAGQGARVTAVAPKPDASGLRVSVDSSAEAGRQLPAVRDAAVPVEVEPGMVPEATSGRFDDTPPYWGGAVWKSSTEACSTGFAVRVAGAPKMLTAGHCAPNGDDAWVGGVNGITHMGIVEHKISTADVELIDTSSSGSMYNGGINGVSGSEYVSKVATTFTGSYKGQYVWTSGAYSGQRGNIKIANTNETINIGETPGSPVWVYGQVRAEQQAKANAIGDGDSGGPVWEPSSTPGFVTAKGTMSAGSSDTDSAHCTGIPDSYWRACSWKMFYEPLTLSLYKLNATLAPA